MNKLSIITLILTSTLFVAGQVQAIELSYSKEEQIIFLEGTFESGDDEKFRAYVNSHPNAVYVSLDSGGGSVAAAQTVATTIRSNHLTTIVYSGDWCLSSCTDAYLGGKERHAGRRAEFGFHAGTYDDYSEYSKQDYMHIGMWWALDDALFYLELLDSSTYKKFVTYLKDNYSRVDASEMEYPSVKELLKMGYVTKRL